MHCTKHARIRVREDRIYNSVNIRENTGQILFLYGRIQVCENPYSRIFYAV